MIGARMIRIAATIAAAFFTGAAMAADMALPAPHPGVTLSLLLWASAGAFAGLAKSGPELWKSILPPHLTDAWPVWARESVRLACVVVTLGINTVLGLAATWALNHYLVHVDVSDLWWLAVLVCFATQRQAPAISDALTEAIPAWIRRKLGGDKAAGGDAP